MTKDDLLSKISRINWRFVIKYLVTCYIIGAIVVTGYYFHTARGQKIDATYFFSNFFGFSFFSSSILLIPLSILYGILRAIASKQIQLRWKILIASLTVVSCLLIYLLSVVEKSSIRVLPTFHIGDIKKSGFTDTYVTASGTWLSNIKLATPIQTTKIDCWRDKGLAIVTDAQLFGPQLFVDNTYYEIDKWTDDEITFKDCDASIYCMYRLHIDRKNKAVTLMRYTKEPKSEGGEGIQNEPIFMHLGDGKV